MRRAGVKVTVHSVEGWEGKEGWGYGHCTFC